MVPYHDHNHLVSFIEYIKLDEQASAQWMSEITSL